MEWIKYFKAEPTEFVRISAGGKVKDEGTGISAIYLPFRTSIELVSVATNDQPFAFTEITKDNQDVILQGGFLYKIENPEKIVAKYNFSIDPREKNYINEDHKKVSQHLLQLVQTSAKRYVQATPLENVLSANEHIAKIVTEDLSLGKHLEDLGIMFSSTYISSIRPKPEISKALEAKFRESLLQKADEAIYERRAFAVEKERTIQQNELQTKIDIEEKRKALVDLESRNRLAESESKSRAMKLELSAYDSIDAQRLASLGILKLGEQAEKIGSLYITPELIGLLRGGSHA